MKIRVIGFLALFLIWTSAGLTYDWGEVFTAQGPPQDLVHDAIILSPAQMDSACPDTIYYDDGIGNYLIYGPTNIWADVRFTPADSFELHSVYLKVLNSQNTPGRAATMVLQNGPGNMPTNIVLSNQVPLPNPPPGSDWLDFNFDPPLTFAPLQDFHICYGPAPAGSYPGPGWWTNSDPSGVVPARSYYSTGTSVPPSWTQSAFGDFLIRAGGEYVNPFTDLWNVNTFTTNKMFFLAPGTEVTLKSTIENIGMTDVPTFSILWQIRDNGGNIVYSYEGIYGPINEGQTVAYTAADIWTTSAIGNYFVTSTITVPGESNTTNNNSYLEQYVTTTHGGIPLTYVQETLGGSSTYFTWGITFNLPEEPPAKIDSFSINFGEATAADIAIYLNDGAGNQPGTMVWSTTAAIPGAGVYTFIPEAPGGTLSIFEDMFTIYYEGDGSLMRGGTNFIAASNDSMMTVAWDNNQGWAKMYSGDWPFTVYIDTSNAIPPDPTIDLNVSSIVFDTTMVSDTSWFDLIISNNGGGDPLVINGFAINPPPGIFAVTNYTPPNDTIAAGSSFTYILRFTPQAATAYSTSLGIFNNVVTPFLMVPMSGVGIPFNAVSNGAPSIPTKFELAQNQPNPFNPSTFIGYSLPSASKVELVVFNMKGEKVATLVNQEMPAGYHLAYFNAAKLSSGVYFYRLTAGNFTDMKKMVLMK
jgi:hypothetical protein